MPHPPVFLSVFLFFCFESIYTDLLWELELIAFLVVCVLLFFYPSLCDELISREMPVCHLSPVCIGLCAACLHVILNVWYVFYSKGIHACVCYLTLRLKLWLSISYCTAMCVSG